LKKQKLKKYGTKSRLNTSLNPRRKNNGGIKNADTPSQRNIMKCEVIAPANPSQLLTSFPDSVRLEVVRLRLRFDPTYL